MQEILLESARGRLSESHVDTRCLVGFETFSIDGG